MNKKHNTFSKLSLLIILGTGFNQILATDDQSTSDSSSKTFNSQTSHHAKTFVSGAVIGSLSTLAAIPLVSKNTPPIKNTWTSLGNSTLHGFVRGSATTAGVFALGYTAYRWKGKEVLQQVKKDFRSDMRNDVERATNNAISATKKRLKWPLSALIKDEEQDGK
ncbi:hypothetical protein KJZ61_02145 [Candidatus Dependentiae bacterium]|nr:hypothetical protein [Candidatus Dependentiae bacterium]